ncbi:hypothetical protein FGG33_gp43 [Mycobacterium phage Benedict]|uniref:Uncharacterized protein n=1 Tax=Mycobacterium phage Benedict TaxID=2902890 RepID=G1EDK1_9CAUD|nr:hypothetical protein FGG33_gp43 [Mycobacterium phage Benedict]AEJ93463.1 hypothetical protein BENEDICT_54 [Mycobacterium phage Benedict]
MTNIVVSLNDGNGITVNGDSFDEYDGILYVYDNDERVAIFNKDEWAFGVKQPPTDIRDPVEPGARVAVTQVSTPSDSPYRAPQTWEYLLYIPTHLTLRDGDRKLWHHNGKTWVREDGRASTSDWSGPFTEVIE